MATGIEAYGIPRPPAQAPQGTIWGGGSGGGSQYYQGGGSFGVGPSGPSKQGFDFGPGGSFAGLESAGFQGFGGPGNPGFDAIAGQQQAINSNFGKAAGLLGTNYANSNFGRDLFNQYQNPHGMSEQAMQLQRNLLAQAETGSRENNLRALTARATAGGFGDSMGLNDAQARVRAGSNANLQRGYNDIFLANEDRKTQIKFQAAQMFMQLYGMDAQQAARMAELWANKQEAAIPGITQGPQGAQPVQTGGYWNQGGKYMQGPVGYDPFAPQNKGYNPQQPYQAW